MLGNFKILFYKDGIPVDYRCIQRFMAAFPIRYQEIVEKIVEKSEKRLDEKIFRCNIVTLMPAFKMTRRGAFQGVGIDAKENNVIDKCWKQVGNELQKLKEDMKENTVGKRGRVIRELPLESRRNIIEKTSELFEKLCTVTVKGGSVTRVGASKVLFAALPEVALPVDNLEWDYVFCTKKYDDILSRMADEITKWEEKNVPKKLDEVAPNITLPAIYNVLAMSVRPLEKARR